MGSEWSSRELLFYQDPKTGEIMDQWTNPWTGETVEVLHVANDPVNWGSQYELDSNGNPFQMRSFQYSRRRLVGHSTTVHYSIKIPSVEIFKNTWVEPIMQQRCLIQREALKILTDDSKDTAKASIGWERISYWLPWMKMNGRNGIVYFHTFGKKLDSYDDLPESMKEVIKSTYPKYDRPPPTDDQRRNETSWTYFKKCWEGL